MDAYRALAELHQITRPDDPRDLDALAAHYRAQADESSPLGLATREFVADWIAFNTEEPK